MPLTESESSESVACVRHFPTLNYMLQQSHPPWFHHPIDIREYRNYVCISRYVVIIISIHEFRPG
jgi:hypothetical protein